jgi:hypothetical protein
MHASELNQLIVEVSQEFITLHADEEEPIFQDLCEAYFQNMDIVLKSPDERDEPLGFGIGEPVTYLTPAVIYILSKVVNFLLEIAKESIKDGSEELLSEAVKDQFKKYRSKNIASPLTPEQLLQVRELILSNSKKLNLPRKKANLLADVVVGSLVSQIE